MTRSQIASALGLRRGLREAIGFAEKYDYLLHARDGIFATHLDESMERLGITVLLLQRPGGTWMGQ